MTTLDCVTSTSLDEPRSAATIPVPTDGMATGSGTVLLAEDDSAVRGLIGSILQQEGYQVIVAENGNKALDLCRHYAGPIRALITDVIMPEVNGRELAEMARAVRPDLKVLFVSGYVDRGPKEQSPGTANAFLEKPFTAEGLLDTLAALCLAGQRA